MTEQDKYLPVVKSTYEFLISVGIHSWTLNFLIITSIVLLIIILVLKLGWKYIEPFLTWMKTNVFINKDRRKVWDDVQWTKTEVIGLKDVVLKIDDKMTKMIDAVTELTNDMGLIKENQATQDGKINLLSRDAELYQEKLKQYSSDELDRALILEMEIDSYLFNEFWNRVVDLGSDNYNSLALTPMFHTLIQDALRFGDKRTQEMMIPHFIQKVLEEASELTNKYAQMFFEQFVMMYENKELQPRMKYLKSFVDKTEAEYKSFFKEIFQKLIKRALHG